MRKSGAVSLRHPACTPLLLLAVCAQAGCESPAAPTPVGTYQLVASNVGGGASDVPVPWTYIAPNGDTDQVVSGSLALASDSTYLRLEQTAVCHGGVCSPLAPNSWRGPWGLVPPPSGDDFAVVFNGTSNSAAPIEATIRGRRLTLGTLIYERP